jgi:hypothetical protein
MGSQRRQPRTAAYTLWRYERLYQSADLTPAETAFLSALPPNLERVTDGQNAVSLSEMSVLRFGSEGCTVLP